MGVPAALLGVRRMVLPSTEGSEKPWTVTRITPSASVLSAETKRLLVLLSSHPQPLASGAVVAESQDADDRDHDQSVRSR